MKAKIIDQKSSEGAYGITYLTLIIDHPRHGLLLARQGYGGDDVSGQTYRWRHGVVARLRTGDTIEQLETAEWNPCTSLISAVLHGEDTSRPVLDWSGCVIKSIVEAAE